MEWYKYTIFISSTFKDMDAERDAIKFDVINKLNWHYRQRHLQFQAIDLRIGINTENISEEESENMVLDVCLDYIEKSRPFFIALLGDRYGWIPNEKRWEEVIGQLSAEKRQLLSGSRHCSVTEMEILYGAIGGEGENLNHSLFFFREKKSYEGIPTDMISTYKDPDDNSQPAKVSLTKREEALKQKILKLTWENDMEDACISYSLKWNGTNKCFEGTDCFADLVYEKLCHEIDKEIEKNEPPQQWQLQESQTSKARAASMTIDTVLLPFVKNAITDLINGGAQILLTGGHGCGKSIALSHVYKYLQQREDVFCLIAFVATTDRSHRMSDILIRWIYELENCLGMPVTDDTNLTSLPIETLSLRLYKLTRSVSDEKGLHVVYMVDAIEHFVHTDPRDLYLTWLTNDARFIGTVTSNGHRQITHHRNMRVIDVSAEANMAIPQIIRKHEERHNIEIPAVVKDGMIKARWLPIQVSLLMRVYANFSTDDFSVIRSFEANSEIFKINRYMEHLYKDVSHEDIAKLFHFAVSFVMKKIHAGEQMIKPLQYIALSGSGLSEQELELLIGNEWDMLRFHKLMTIFTDCFIEDMNSHRWNYCSPQLRNAMIPDEFERKMLYADMARLLLTYTNDNPQKRSLLVYCLIEAENPQLGRDLLTDPASGENHWWDISLSFLLEDKDLASHIFRLCTDYNSHERIGFAYALYTAIPYATQLPLLCQVEEKILSTITPDDLEASSSYKLGNYYGYLFLHHREKYCDTLMLSQCDLKKAPYYLDRSINFFKWCYIINPDYADVCNMLRASMSQMLPLIAEKGDFSRVEAYNEEINRIQ